MDANEGVDGGDEGGVEEGPVGGGHVGQSKAGIPGAGKAVAMAAGQTGGEHRVGGFVFGRRCAVTQVEGDNQAQEDGQEDDDQEKSLVSRHELWEFYELGKRSSATDYMDWSTSDRIQMRTGSVHRFFLGEHNDTLKPRLEGGELVVLRSPPDLR